MLTKDLLLDKIEKRTARVGIIGLGYVGLPLAVEFARAGFRVLGYDVSERVTKLLNDGQSHIADVPASTVAALVKEGKLESTIDAARLGDMDAISIAVPTPLSKTRDPDMAYVLSATETVARSARPGQVIILESTTYPGTTREMLQPAMEARGLVVGRDVFLAFSPERVDPGNEKWNTHNTPKVVGGITAECTEVAVALYSACIEQVIAVSSPEAAELTKLLENTFRAVNIGMVNELALMCDRLGIDVWEVVRAAATKPFGFMPFYPGPGLGGHCIPIDPFYLSWKARQAGFEARFIELAGTVNGAMPHYVVTLVADALNTLRLPLNGSKVLLAGVSYKRNVDDIRESPALDLLALLGTRGATVSYSDPHVPKLSGRLWQGGVDLEHVDLASVGPDAYDCIVVVTDHSAFNYDDVQRAAKVVVDTRNAIASPGPNVIRLGAPRPAMADVAGVIA